MDIRYTCIRCRESNVIPKDMLTCGHGICENCIQKWIQPHCPQCNQLIRIPHLVSKIFNNNTLRIHQCTKNIQELYEKCR